MKPSIELALKPGLIVLPVILEYRFRQEFKLALDTGAVLTVITPHVAQEVGFEESQLISTTEVTGVTGSELVPKIRLNSITLFDNKVENIAVTVINLPLKLRIDGLLGLNFLNHFNINLQFETFILALQKY